MNYYGLNLRIINTIFATIDVIVHILWLKYGIILLFSYLYIFSTCEEVTIMIIIYLGIQLFFCSFQFYLRYRCDCECIRYVEFDVFMQQT